MKYIKIQRTEQHLIRKQHPMWHIIDQMCVMSKNLYNYANYILRQEFTSTGRYIPYREMNRNLKTSDDYKSCMSQPANCTLRLLDKNWKDVTEKYLDTEESSRSTWIFKEVGLDDQQRQVS